MIVLLGGTFDPVHYGHLRSAWEVREALRPHEFRLLPAGEPPHREQAVTAAHHRLAMLQLALRGLPGMAIDQRELERPGPSWMVDTLEDVRSEVKNTPVSLVIGQDSAADLDSWHRWQALFDLAHLVIMRRPGGKQSGSPALEKWLQDHAAESPESLNAQPCGLVWNVQVTQLAISSSAIRQLIRKGRSPRFLLPETVLDYIGREGLYR